ncbi:MAG: AmmeMemoRadiSam system protein A [Bacteroidales bacterium]|nr:AmmeMemoRadiSam system protein A [Bacteroidales bacterium]MCF8454913.1 AmmeMemoRadiSam system protein A [Bacteroidales bacterium]
MYEPKSIYTQLALEAIIAKVKGQPFEASKELQIDENLKMKRACFVSIHLTNGDLRGCIGTIKPVEENLFFEIIRNAEAACTRDSRFEPVIGNELDDLEISVDVLSLPEEIRDISELDVENYGVIVSDGHYQRGVLLPNIPSVTSVEEQLKIVKRKAGIHQKSLKGLKIERFTSTRYY